MKKVYLGIWALAVSMLGYGQCVQLNGNVALQEVTRTSMGINFYAPNYDQGTATGGDDLYTIEYGMKGFTLGTGTVDQLIPNDSWFTREFTGLTLETTYEFYVKEACDAGESSMAGPFEFTTDGECANLPNLNYGRSNSATSVEYCGLPSNNPGATYRVQLIQDPWTSPVILETRTGDAPSEYCEEFTGLTESTSYGVQIKEFCVNGDSTELHMGESNTIAICAELNNFWTGSGINQIEPEVSVYEHQIGETLTFEYGESPLTPGSGQTIEIILASRDTSIVIAGLTSNTAYDIIGSLSCASGTIPAVTRIVTTLDDCVAPETDGGIAFHDHVKLFPYFYQTGAQYTVIYGPSGFDHRTGGSTVNGVVSEDGNTVDIAGLTATTAYDFYFFAACSGGTTDTIGPETITTKAYVAPPSNDACANAITLSVGATMGSNAGSTGNDRPTVCMYDITQQSTGVWYKFTASQTGDHVFDLCSDKTEFDSQLEIFTGSCAALTCLVDEDDDDDCGNAHPTIEGSIDAGTYYLYVSGYDYETGDFEINISQTPVGLAENGELNKYISNTQFGKVYLNGFSDLSSEKVRVISSTGQFVQFAIDGQELIIEGAGMFVVEITDGNIYREKVIVE